MLCSRGSLYLVLKVFKRPFTVSLQHVLGNINLQELNVNFIFYLPRMPMKHTSLVTSCYVDILRPLTIIALYNLATKCHVGQVNYTSTVSI